MKPSEVSVGIRFRDNGLTSQPEEYRIHLIESVDDAGGRFRAKHLGSGNSRDFSLSDDALKGLEKCSSTIVAVANLDAMVGRRVVLTLTDGGKLHGKVTAVRYTVIEFHPNPIRIPKEIELDRSGSTAYRPNEIKKIELEE